MRSKHSTASDTAILSKPPAEFYFGGAADESSRLVLSYADARRRMKSAEGRIIRYFPHHQLPAALAQAQQVLTGNHRLILIGHSWGADAALRLIRRLRQPVYLIGADPVAKPAPPFAFWQVRPPEAEFILHVHARTLRPDRSDYVKTAGYWTGGGIPKAYLQADARITTALNHWNFEGMMATPGQDGKSAEDWLEILGHTGKAPQKASL